jgi:SepF-like predicted cell division protein (DUF552 family)
MGLLHDLFKGSSGEEETVEVPEVQEESPGQQVTVRIETIRDFVDVDRIGRLVRDGNIVFIKTRDLQKKDLGEFQNCVQKLKRLTTQFGFDLAGTEDGYLLVTPTFAKIVR